MVKQVGGKANDVQFGGTHYKVGGEEHWDRVWRLGLNYWQAAATKYIERYKKKNGKEDLLKAIHYIQKLIELEYPEGAPINHPETFNPEYAPLASFPQVKPTGWVGFVFEGANVKDSLFTCKGCGANVWVPVNDDPASQHNCDEVKKIRDDVASAAL